MIIHQISENFSPTKHKKWGVSYNKVRLGLWSGYCKTINSSLNLKNGSFTSELAEWKLFPENRT